MVNFTSSSFRWNPYERHIAKIEKLMDSIEKLESVGGVPLTDLTDDDKKNALVAGKYLETARSILRKCDRKK